MKQANGTDDITLARALSCSLARRVSAALELALHWGHAQAQDGSSARCGNTRQ